VPFEADFECAVPAAPLMAALSKYNTTELEMTVEGGELRLKSGRKKNGIKIHKDITIPLDALQPPEEYKPVHPDFPSALGLTCSSCGKNASEYIMTCVHITDEVVEACDRFQITQYNLKAGMGEFLIPGVSAKLLSNVKMTKAGLSNSWFYCLTDEGVTYACRTYKEQYPNIHDIINKNGVAIDFPTSLIDTLNSAAVFTDSGISDGVVQIVVKDGVLTVSSKNNDGWFEEATDEVDCADIMFVINPKFFATLLTHGSSCKASDNMLVVENEYYTHIACLQK